MSQPALVMSRAQPDMGRWVLSATILASAMAFIDGTALKWPCRQSSRVCVPPALSFFGWSTPTCSCWRR